MSKHVIGKALDVGGAGADQWLIANGSRSGLCQIYANELWHFELARDAMGNCPDSSPTRPGNRPEETTKRKSARVLAMT